MSATFTCAHCKGTFEKGWTDEESQAEAKDNFGAMADVDPVLVCDECYQKFMAWFEMDPRKII